VVSRIRELFPFLVAAALIAAGAGDPLVEALAGAGAFGPGYADHNHLGVVPVLLAALALLVAVFALGCYRWRYRARFGRLHAMHAIGLLDLPAILAVQLAAVFGMESLEAALVRAPLQPGLEWLGGPVPLSLAIDAVVALGALALVRRFMRAMPRACAIVVRALELLAVRSSPGSGVKGRAGDEPRAVLQRGALLARRIGGRAPPHSPIQA
jgi:hypothetical protein